MSHVYPKESQKKPFFREVASVGQVRNALVYNGLPVVVEDLQGVDDCALRTEIRRRCGIDDLAIPIRIVDRSRVSSGYVEVHLAGPREEPRSMRFDMVIH